METQLLSVLVSAAGNAWVSEAAARAHVGRTVVLRAMFSVASAHPDEVAAKIAELSKGVSAAPVPPRATPKKKDEKKDAG